MALRFKLWTLARGVRRNNKLSCVPFVLACLPMSPTAAEMEPVRPSETTIEQHLETLNSRLSIEIPDEFTLHLNAYFMGSGHELIFDDLAYSDWKSLTSSDLLGIYMSNVLDNFDEKAPDDVLHYLAFSRRMPEISYHGEPIYVPVSINFGIEGISLLGQRAGVVFRFINPKSVDLDDPNKDISPIKHLDGILFGFGKPDVVEVVFDPISDARMQDFTTRFVSDTGSQVVSGTLGNDRTLRSSDDRLDCMTANQASSGFATQTVWMCRLTMPAVVMKPTETSSQGSSPVNGKNKAPT